MERVSIHIDDSALARLREKSSRRNASVSKYVAELINKGSKVEANGWPEGYWESIYGCLGENNLVIDDDMLDLNLDDTCDWFQEA